MDGKWRGTVEMTAAMVISGTIGWFVVLSGQPVTDVVFWRCAFGFVSLLVVCAGMGLFRVRITQRQFILAALGGVAIVVNWLLLFSAYAHASIAISTVVYNTQPFMLLGLGMLFLGERPPLAKLLWLGLAFVGMVLIVQAKPGVGYVGTNYLAGIGLAMAAAFFYALAALFAKKLTGTPPQLIALIQVGIGVLMLAPLANLTHPPQEAATWGFLVALGVVHTGVMYILLYGAIQRLPTPIIGTLSFIYPLAAVLVDVLAFGHRLHLVQIAGGVAILVAAAAMMLGWSFPGWKARTKAA